MWYLFARCSSPGTNFFSSGRWVMPVRGHCWNRVENSQNELTVSISVDAVAEIIVGGRTLNKMIESIFRMIWLDLGQIVRVDRLNGLGNFVRRNWSHGSGKMLDPQASAFRKAIWWRASEQGGNEPSYRRMDKCQILFLHWWFAPYYCCIYHQLILNEISQFYL